MGSTSRRGGEMFALVMGALAPLYEALSAKNYRTTYKLPSTTAEDALLGARPGPMLPHAAKAKPAKPPPSTACGGKKIDLSQDAYTGDFEGAYYRLECAHGPAGIRPMATF